MLFSPLVAVLLMTLAQPSHEVTTFDDDTMETLLNDGGVGLAMSYAPVWNFGQPQNQAGYSPPCYPTWAFEGSPTTNDTYDLAHQTPGAGLCPYPDVGCSCRNPGVPVGTEAPPFPIYYTYERCSSTEVRVLYNLFYEKDGASGAIKTGHP